MSKPLSATGTRAERLATSSPGAAARVDALTSLAASGLRAMFMQSSQSFPQTARGAASPAGPRLVLEGSSLRYTAMAVLGLSHTDVGLQRLVLRGRTAADLTGLIAARAATDDDLGAVALAAWASAEVSGQADEDLLSTLARRVGSGEALSTVSVSWALTAAVAAAQLTDTSGLRALAVERLLDAQGAQGLFPHALPATSLGRLWSHVGSFADQVYPIQALARLSAVGDDGALLAAADATAQRICDLQGPDGQWWWHYDARTGDVVERFPVYSVHQHAMAPMVLSELSELGGRDHTGSVVRGLQWLDRHPEVLDELIDQRLDVVWRKVGRREPAKASRKLAAVVTAARPGAVVPGLDRLLPPVLVDHECRPYELGWILYTWSAPSEPDDGRPADAAS